MSIRRDVWTRKATVIVVEILTIGCPLSFSPRRADRQTLLPTSPLSLLVSRHPPNLAESASVGPVHECRHLAAPAFVVTVNPADLLSLARAANVQPETRFVQLFRRL